MIQIRTMKQVASSRTIPSFRSCPSARPANQSHLLDQGRMMMGRAQVLAQDAHRQWRNGVWRSRP
ncbi:hypothetical protein [Halomicronema sp. CCY15110]|uniref:hypothetical protein n=1 Tax=Halomicronema sp. CCY15110 TaxID=2767773 RepID=UPI0019501CFC|nr:hypothetical protein [Halomicronema sp. CCY15110]